MCGIAAILGLDPLPKPRGWMPPGGEAALARLTMRGPDSGAHWTCNRGTTWLGHRRLIVVDPSPEATQPFVDERGVHALVCNGEIYNAEELRPELEARGHKFRSRSDNEVLLHGYVEWGEHELLRRVRGMYAFVLWDGARQRAILANDHIGMKPLYFSQQSGVLHVASDADALRALLPSNAALDPVGLAHVLSLGYCPAPGTVWRDISKLQPGRAIVFDAERQRLTTFRHWVPPETTIGPEVDREFATLWPSVVREHLRSDVAIGLLLSSGIDSSAIAVAASDLGTRLHCTTLSLPGESDEAQTAASNAELLGLPHAAVPLAIEDTGELLARAALAFDEPQAFGALLTMTLVSAEAKRHGTVVLTGDGGDEAFAGYTWHRSSGDESSGLPHARLAAAVASPDAPADLRTHALHALGSLSWVHGHLQRVFPRFHPSEARALLSPLGCEYDEEHYVAWLVDDDIATLPPPRRAQRLDLAGFCAGSILPKVDRATMAVGVEARCPFLDKRLLELALSAAPREDETQGRGKAPLRRYLRGRVPDHVMTRPKQGFSLRLGHDVWRRRIDWLRGTRLVASGALHARWDAFVAPDTPSADARVYALCMLAAWAEARI
ncbi:MAG: asparagine synthase (glutamine-hydrolyzing) [Planctomycetes bacterium]|nr:asparagine synthase (glutamine-hydrolyzing) [Planctomycetota bacterium]